jgi:hypothetical protein
MWLKEWLFLTVIIAHIKPNSPWSDFSGILLWCTLERKVWRYYRGNQKPLIQEGQTMQWQKKNKYRKRQTMICKTLHRKLKNMDLSRVQRKGKHVRLYWWRPSFYTCYKPVDKSWMRKGPDCHYDKRNISVVICNTDILYRFTRSRWLQKNFRSDFNLTTRKPWLSRFLVSSNTLSGKLWQETQNQEYPINWEIYSIIWRCCYNVATCQWKVHNGEIHRSRIGPECVGWPSLGLDRKVWWLPFRKTDK